MKPWDPWLREQLRPARAELATVVAAGVVSCGLVLAQAWAVTGLVIAVLQGRDLTRPTATVLAVLVARGLAGFAGDVSAARAAGVVGTSLRCRLTATTVERDVGTPSGELGVLTTRGVEAAEPYLTRYLPALVLAAVLPPLAVVAIATQDVLSAVIVLATLPLVPVFGALVGLATRDRAREQWRELASLSGHFLDVVRGLPTLVVHRRARAQSRRIAEITDRYRRASLRTLRIAFASSLVLELVATLSVALVAVTTGVRLAQGSLGLHTALVVLLLAPEAYWPLRRVGAEFHAAAEGVATYEAIQEVLTLQPEPLGATRRPGPATPGFPLLLRDVTVTHPGRVRPAVTGVHAVLPDRGLMVVTGASGSGKSTLLESLAGVLPIAGGAVTADGRLVGGRRWQQQVAWLPQRPVFVAGTIADNLRLGRPDAIDQRLWDALRTVALEERIRATAHGLETDLGEDGVTLSAGERARLALARVVLADRPWMLLDEPTAHLDELTEQVIVDALQELGRRGAVIVVSHRPTVMAAADYRIDLSRPADQPDEPLTIPVLGAAPALVAEPSTATPSLGFALSTVLSASASACGVALTATAGWLVVQAAGHPAVLTMLVAIVGVRAFGLGRPVLRYAERLRSHDAALRLLARRRVEVYDAIVPLTPGRLGRRRGDLLSAVVDDVDGIVDRELRVRLPWRSYAVVAALATAAAAVVHPATAPFMAAGALVGGGGGWWVARLGADSNERSVVRTRAALSAHIVETIQVARELRMWQATRVRVEQTKELSDRLGRAATRATAWSAAGRAWVLAVMGTTMAAVAVTAAPAVSTGRLSGPMMALLLLVPLALCEVAAPLADAGALSVRTDAAAERLRALERTAPAVRDTVTKPVPPGQDLRAARVRGRWAPDAPLTSACTLTLEPGERIALVGPSGSGKSTIAALLVRFLDPVSGTVRRGGTDLRDLALDDVRRITGYVDDDPHVFATTVAENVRLARPGASDREVANALTQARLGAWVAALPEGMSTWLGEGHSGLSGGERARLGVARALLADQSVLVLDEPAAHLDHATASELAQEVLLGHGQRALLWITHNDVGLDLVDRTIQLGNHLSDGDALGHQTLVG